MLTVKDGKRTTMNPPPVADVHANAVLDRAVAGPVTAARTRNGRAAKRLNTSEELLGQGFVTIPEHGEQAVYAATETNAALAGAGIPPLPPGAPARFDY